jgi:hypothetical protein
MGCFMDAIMAPPAGKPSIDAMPVSVASPVYATPMPLKYIMAPSAPCSQFASR